MTPCSSPCQWALDFPGFMAQPRTAFKRDIPLRQRDDWEEWLASRCAEIVRLETQQCSQGRRQTAPGFAARPTA